MNEIYQKMMLRVINSRHVKKYNFSPHVASRDVYSRDFRSRDRNLFDITSRQLT